MHHEPGKKETQQKLPFRLPRSTRAGGPMGSSKYSRRSKYPYDYWDELEENEDEEASER